LRQSLTLIPPHRTTDKHGSGSYGAARGDRSHRGIDYAAYPGSTLLSPVSGLVNRIGYPYSRLGPKGDYQLIEIQVDDQTMAKFFYLDPLVQPGRKVMRGQPLGIVQDLGKVYPGITNHFHLEIWIEGQHVNPQIWLDNYGE